MTLVRYNPLNDFIPGTFGDLLENVLNSPKSGKKEFTPAVDILKDDKSYEIHVIAPGMTKENFKIDLDEARLTISGERKIDEKVKDKYKKIESYFGSFERSFKLSEEINIKDINASYHDGILQVTLPLKDKKESKLEIKVK